MRHTGGFGNSGFGSLGGTALSGFYGSGYGGYGYGGYGNGYGSVIRIRSHWDKLRLSFAGYGSGYGYGSTYADTGFLAPALGFGN